jgi:hypothetical protein
MDKSLEALAGVDVPSFTIQSLKKWLQDTFTPSYRSEVEEYLAQSTDYGDFIHRENTLRNRGML